MAFLTEQHCSESAPEPAELSIASGNVKPADKNSCILPVTLIPAIQPPLLLLLLLLPPLPLPLLCINGLGHNEVDTFDSSDSGG